MERQCPHVRVDAEAEETTIKRGAKGAEILGDPYDKKVPLPRIPNSRPLGSRHNTHDGQYYHASNTAQGQYCHSDNRSVGQF